MTNALILSIIYCVLFIVYTVFAARGIETVVGSILMGILGTFLLLLPCRLFFEICI